MCNFRVDDSVQIKMDKMHFYTDLAGIFYDTSSCGKIRF